MNRQAAAIKTGVLCCLLMMVGALWSPASAGSASGLVLKYRKNPSADAAAESRPASDESGEGWDVAFYWTDKLHHALDYLEEVGIILGGDTRMKLRVVKRRTGAFGVIFGVNGSRTRAEQVADGFSGDLAQADMPPASAVKRGGYFQLLTLERDKNQELELQKQAVSGQPALSTAVPVGSEPREHPGASLQMATAPKEIHVPPAGTDPEKPAAWVPVPEPAAGSPEPAGEQFGPPAVSAAESVGAASGILLRMGLPPSTKELESRIRSYLFELRKRGRIVPDERTSWAVFDLKNGEKLVSINESHPRQTASMVKPLVALAFFHEAAAGRMAYTAECRHHMERMIQWSDNVSTNWVMARLGGPDVIDRLIDAHYGAILRDVKIADYIPLNPAERQRARSLGLADVPRGQSYYKNWASALDYNRFLYSLWNDALPHAGELKRLMVLPNRDRVYYGASRVPKGTRVYDKTGTTARLCGDMAILEARGQDGGRYAYTLVGIIEKENRALDYIAWKNDRGDIIREVSNMVYAYQKQRYDLF